MSFEVKQGLFQLEFTDSHAILGVPLNAEFNDIRKRYTRIARRLHPDTCPFDDPKQKELAKQLLAKLVSPAYNRFSKENERKEYALLLKTIGDRAIKERQKLQLQSQAAQQILKAPDYQTTYSNLLDQLSKKQFETPNETLGVIGEISELNLAYLLRSSQRGARPVTQPKVSSAPSGSAPSSTSKTSEAAPKTARPKADSFVDQACRRAEQLIASQAYSQAVLELKDAAKREPNNSRCHALLGSAYFKQGQPKLANPHIKRALTLDPQQAEALEIKKQLDKLSGSTAKSKSSSKSSEGGLFGGLFGGKKK